MPRSMTLAELGDLRRQHASRIAPEISRAPDRLRDGPVEPVGRLFVVGGEPAARCETRANPSAHLSERVDVFGIDLRAEPATVALGVLLTVERELVPDEARG